MPGKAVQVNPAVLEWARAVGGFTLDEAADRLSVPPARLHALEHGAERPTLTLLRRIAKLYALPLGTLLMPEPIPAPSPPEDMRTVGGQHRPLSPKTLRTIREVRERQELAQEIVANAPELYPRPSLANLEHSENPSQAGESERKRLAPEWRAQLAWNDASQALREWRLLLESQRILVFSEPMDRDDARGFCLLDHAEIPVIVVNSRESSQARCFTLFHEYAHLLLRGPALCLELEVDVDRAQVEAFCNRFAAAFLMPEPAIDDVFRDAGGNGSVARDLDSLSLAASRLKVSRPALALRLEQLGRAPRGYFDEISNQLAAETWIPKSTRRGGPRFSISLLSRLGTRYPSLVLDALQARVIDAATAGEMLNAPARALPDIARDLGR